MSDITLGNQKVGDKEVKPIVYLGGLIGDYTNNIPLGYNISNNTLTNLTISHNFGFDSNRNTINSIYPVAGQVIGYTNSTIGITSNTVNNVNVLGYKDEFSLFTALYHKHVNKYTLGLYYVRFERSYSGNYMIGRVGAEKEGRYIQNGNIYAPINTCGVYPIINNTSNNKDVANSNYGYCKVTKTSDYGNVIKQYRTGSIFGEKYRTFNLDDYKFI